MRSLNHNSYFMVWLPAPGTESADFMMSPEFGQQHKSVAFIFVNLRVRDCKGRHYMTTIWVSDLSGQRGSSES